MTFRTVRKLGVVTFCVMWAAVIVASYIFVGKPPACFIITQLPFTIESAGCYRFTEDLALADPAGTGVLIRSNNVRLDLGGHRIKGTSDLRGAGVGISAQGVHDVIVENGAISGFLYGLRIEERRGRPTERFTLRNVTVEGNTFRGAHIEGMQIAVEDVVVERTGGTLFFPDASVTGLELSGADCRVVKTKVRETYPVGSGTGVAIQVTGAVHSCTLEDNELSNSRSSRESKTFGIQWPDDAARPTLLRNRITGFKQPLPLPPR